MSASAAEMRSNGDGAPLRVDEGTAKRIRELREKRRHAAFVVGVAWFEFMDAWENMRARVEQWKREEREIAEDVLDRLGIDLEHFDASIDDDGTVHVVPRIHRGKEG